MPKRTNEEIAAEREKEKLRALRRGPDLDRFLEGKKRTFVSYAEGARIYSMNYYSCLLSECLRLMPWLVRTVY